MDRPRRVVRYEVDAAARTVTVDAKIVYSVRKISEETYEVWRGDVRVGSFDVEARDGGKWDAFVSAEDGEDADLVRSVVRAARRGGLAP
ncbi:MAG: hypothetical protein ACXVEE_22485 [Polyangiales bacterium]